MGRSSLHLLRNVSPLAGKTVKVYPVKGTEFENLQQGALFDVIDWYENVNGQTWSDGVDKGNFACLHYFRRALIAGTNFPVGYDVLYGHIGTLGYLVHVSEVETSVKQSGEEAIPLPLAREYDWSQQAA